MRKVLSLVLVAAMLMCGIVIPTSTAATAVLEDNVAATANYFGGTVNWVYNYGAVGKNMKFEEPETVKEGTGGTITLDGTIDEGEWGDVAVHVDSKYAANNMNSIGKWIDNGVKNDTLFPHVSAENTYFFGSPAAVADLDLEYDLYFLWDEDFLYIAAHVVDPYNFKNTNTGKDLWDGDALQFIVDTKGPNSAAVANGTTYAYLAEHGIIHDSSSGNEVITYRNAPWEGNLVKDGATQAYYSEIPNFMVAYTTSGGGYSDMYDAALRYNPTEVEKEVSGDDGSVTIETETQWSGASVQYYIEDDIYADAGLSAYATVCPVNHGTARDPNYTIDYEVAIPWAMLSRTNQDGTFQDEYVPEVGAELGISVAALNASKSANSSYDSWLTWGSGVCGYQTYNDYQTAGGSNLLTLSDRNYKDYTACTHSFAAATCTAPETCSICGYKRGYESGHQYVMDNGVLPTASTNGSATATCSTCGDVKNIVLNSSGEHKWYEFKSTDTSINTDRIYGGFSANWYDGPSTDADGNTITRNMLYYKDANGTLKAKTCYDTGTFGYAVADLATTGEGLFLETGEVATIDPDFNEYSQTGTYFECSTSSDHNMTYKADLYIPYYDSTDPMASVTDGKVPYTRGIYNWFGKTVVSYMAGFFVFNQHTGNPTYVFAIASADLCQSSRSMEEFTSKAIAYKVVDPEVVATETWHEYVFVYDDDAQYAAVYWDDELMISAYCADFKYVSGVELRPIMRRIEVPLYVKDVCAGPSGLASTFVSASVPTPPTPPAPPVEDTYTATINGKEFSYKAGETVTVTAPNGAFYSDDGLFYRFTGWTGAEFAKVTDVETTFVMPANDVTITANYLIIGDLNADDKLNSIDLSNMRSMIIGSAAPIDNADIDYDSKVNSADANLLMSMILGEWVPEK